MRVRQLAIIAAMGLVACGGSGTEPTTKAKIDPFVTFMVENLTSAGSKLNQSTPVRLVIMPDTMVNWGAVDPGKPICRSMSGYIGDRTVSLYAVADTVGALTDKGADSVVKSLLAAAPIPSGIVVRSTLPRDALVSADTTRGFTRERPVKWRWTLTDSGAVLREDSTTTCEIGF